MSSYLAGRARVARRFTYFIVAAFALLGTPLTPAASSSGAVFVGPPVRATVERHSAAVHFRSPMPPWSSTAPVACATFAETGRMVCDPFLAYWQNHGGIPRQGLPISAELVETSPVDGRPYLVQYFERARFEYHPENAEPYAVLLGLLGREQFSLRYHGSVLPAADDPFGNTGGEHHCERFPPTNEHVCGPFLDHWWANGGLAQLGLPISPVFLETNPTDSRQYSTQYFERARLEYHPGPTNNGVVLQGLLGSEQLLEKYPGGPPPVAGPAPNPSPSVSPTPTPGTAANPRPGCDPAYPTVYIPPPPPILECGKIPYRNFPVLPPDPHAFDTDSNGIGCESY